MTEREFVLRRGGWLYVTLAVLSLVYFIALVALALMRFEIKGVSTQLMVFAGIGLFALTLLVEIPFFFRRRVRPLEAMPVDLQDEVPEAQPLRVDDEYFVTQETQQGLQVLEYSVPAKSRRRGAVYAKSYVPVTASFVLRVETLAASTEDL